MILTYVRFDSCDWEAWYLGDDLLIERHVVSALDLAFKLATALGPDLLVGVRSIDDALLDAKTGMAPSSLKDVKRRP